MADRLILKLEHFIRLSADERAAIQDLTDQRHRIPAHTDVAREGEKPSHVSLLLDGLGARYRLLEDGRRQIVGLFLPGDFCDARLFVLRSRDHSIFAASEAQVAQIPKDAVVGLTDAFPRIRRAFWWSALVEESIAREWIVNVGQRSAYERLAHFFCELFVRLRMVQLTTEDSCAMPFTQAELADALGITTVHVNRTLMSLRADGLITLARGRLTIHDLARLMDVAFFDPDYLHLDHEGSAFDANEV